MRKTKIICTIGPSSEDPAIFREMCLKGLNVARLNFSHGTHEEHQKKIDMIKAVREELNLPIAIMLDTKGPEYRIRTFKNEKVRADSVKKETVVADDQNTTRKLIDRLFENSHCLNVEIVRWFIEKEKIASTSKELREVDAIAFAA